MSDCVVYGDLWKNEIAAYEEARKVLKETEMELRQKVAPVLIKAEGDLDIVTIHDMISELPKNRALRRFLFEAGDRVSKILSENKDTGT